MDKENLKFENWADYWSSFDNFCWTFENSDREFVSDELKEAKFHVNGMTDGWFEFLDIFEKSISGNRKRLTEAELMTANDLINYIKIPLTRR